MTLILKLDLDMVKMYLQAKNEVKRFKSYSLNRQKHRQTDTQTHRHTDRQTDRHTGRQTDRHDRKHYLPAYAGGNNLMKTGNRGRIEHTFCPDFSDCPKTAWWVCLTS